LNQEAVPGFEIVKRVSAYASLHAGSRDSARQTAQTVLTQLRAELRDPAHGGHAAQIRGAKNAAHQRANYAWSGERRDADTFTREILAGLQHRMVPDLAAATGLSEVYCSLIRLGKRVPHPRHWAALRRLAPDEQR
jgi:hypothetical protein